MTNPPTTPSDPDGEREKIARVIALHGLGTVSGLDHRGPPNASWTKEEWERRILECVPYRVERQCYELADAILALRTAKAGWRSIETALKDGTLIDLWWDGVRLADCWWQNIDDMGWVCSKQAGQPFLLSDIRADPTHWMLHTAPNDEPALRSPPSPGDEIQRLREALLAIQAQVSRPNCAYVHLKRLVALQVAAALSDGEVKA